MLFLESSFRSLFLNCIGAVTEGIFDSSSESSSSTIMLFTALRSLNCFLVLKFAITSGLSFFIIFELLAATEFE